MLLSLRKTKIMLMLSFFATRARDEGRQKSASAREKQDRPSGRVTPNESTIAIVCTSELVRISNVGNDPEMKKSEFEVRRNAYQ